MLVDEVTIKVAGGKGGNGSVQFGEGKFSKNPSGGAGGNGGSIYIEASREMGDLSHYRFEKDFKAGDGEVGRRQKDGHDGKDITLKVPRGTIVHNKFSGEVSELMEYGNKVLAVRGGLRGRGNKSFCTARSCDVMRADEGKPGYATEIFMELQLIADIGLVGLPNVGKSSLLNVLTGAKSQVGNYNFTTLEPYLGVLKNGAIMADIPGLIEGASEGRGLGTKFLRHIRRTKLIAHCIAADSEDVKRDYKIIRKELENYSPELAEKPEFIILTKTDEVLPKELKKKEAVLKKLSKNYFAVSIFDDVLLKKLGEKLMKFVTPKTKKD